MKKYLIVVIAILFYSSFAQAQILASGQTVFLKPRRINYNFITRDSVNLALSSTFDLIEDSCSQVIRYARLNMKQRKFFGPIKDVSKENPQLVLTEGKYNNEGQKDGYFITHYLNGNLQAKGAFKNGAYDGKWEVYYDDNKPRLAFEANGADIKIFDAWDEKGKKYIDNGKGAYVVDMGDVYWKGKLLNGRPDGSWHAIKANDANKTDIVTESYKNGAFQKGKGIVGEYTDASRLALVPATLLPFTNAELLHISMTACDGVVNSRKVNAQYRNGSADFSELIKNQVSAFLQTVDLKPYEDQLTINGEVATNGNIIKLMPQNNPFNSNIAHGLVSKLAMLPPLQPATVDGKPAVQKITFTFTFTQGLYRFTYRFLPMVPEFKPEIYVNGKYTPKP